MSSAVLTTNVYTQDLPHTDPEYSRTRDFDNVSVDFLVHPSDAIVADTWFRVEATEDGTLRVLQSRRGEPLREVFASGPTLGVVA